MENYFNEFIVIAIAHFIALLSPGADFIYLINSSINNKTKVAIGASFGIALSNGFYIMLCLLGYATVLSQSKKLMALIGFIGGIYLSFIGLKIIINKSSISFNKKTVLKQSTFIKELSRGFYLSILNPKISIFYISLFSLAINQTNYSLDDSIFVWGMDVFCCSCLGYSVGSVVW